jgi:hypothetical protein
MHFMPANMLSSLLRPACFACLTASFVALLQNKSSRLDLQQLMAQAVPWLDWQGGTKEEEVRALAAWLWWLAGDTQQRGVVEVDDTVAKQDEAKESDPWVRVSSSDEEDEDWKP